MKKLIAMILVLVMALALCACAAVEDDSIRKSSGMSVGKPIEETTETISEETTEEPTEETTEGETLKVAIAQAYDPSNVFSNINNYEGTVGTIAIKPRYAYWEDGMLIVECFIINGLDKNVTGFMMEDFMISNDDGVIAKGYFGDAQEVYIEPYQNIIHTFRFKGEAVLAENADLNHLILDYEYQYRS